MSEQKATGKKGVYGILLPGQSEPQQIDLGGSGWTGFGIKGQIADKVESIKGTDTGNIRLFVGEREILDGEFVDEVLAEAGVQVIRAELKAEGGERK